MPDIPHENDFSPADLHWKGETPCSNTFDDVYFSLDSGVEETRYVFIENNGLPDRLAAPNKEAFTIGEIGFGTGLNFLTTWHAFQNVDFGTACPRLHFISVEKHPLTKPALTKALAHWPKFAELSKQLIAQYPMLTPGWHRLWFPHCTLSLWFGEGLAGYESLLPHPPTIDAWYLDGFAPAKNPQLWNEDLLKTIAQLSEEGTTLATFTAVGAVRRQLQANGFAMEKVAGYGRKREMLKGTYQKSTSQTKTTTSPTRHTTKHIAVIGAGVSGTSCAWQLVQRGYQVTVYDTHSHPAQGASGNAKGVL